MPADNELPPQISESEGAMAHENAGYSTRAEGSAAETVDSNVGAAVETTIEIPLKGPGGDTDPATQKWREENWVDEGTANARSEVEDEEATNAADNRRVATVIKNFEPTEKEQEAPHLAEQRAKRELKDMFFDRDNPVSPNKYFVEMSDGLVGYGDKKERIVNRLREYAERNDRDAKRLGDWAEVLHKHPVHEEYKHAHIGRNFDPVSMVRYEDYIEDEESNIEWIEERCREYEKNGFLGVNFSRGRSMEPFVHEHEVTTMADHYAREAGEDVNYAEKWKAMRTNPDATLRDVGKLFAEMVRKGELARMKQELVTGKTIIEDVKSGKASQSPEPTEQAA